MKLLTIIEACELLRISRATLYKLIKAGNLTLVKIGKRSLIPEDALECLVQRSLVVPKSADERLRLREQWFNALLRQGVVSSASRQAFLAPTISPFEPVKATGPLASELLIAERGER